MHQTESLKEACAEEPGNGGATDFDGIKEDDLQKAVELVRARRENEQRVKDCREAVDALLAEHKCRIDIAIGIQGMTLVPRVSIVPVAE